MNEATTVKSFYSSFMFGFFNGSEIPKNIEKRCPDNIGRPLSAIKKETLNTIDIWLLNDGSQGP